MKKLLFVFNPNAGKGAVKSNLFNIIDLFTKNDYEVTTYPTQERLDGYRMILKNAGGYDLIVTSGGDGTLNESIKGLMDGKHNVPIGYIPTGTTNDFAHSFEIPKNILKAAENIITGTSFAYDVGSLNGEYFCYVAAFGAFTEVPYTTSQITKNLFGHLAYLMEAVKHIKTMEAYNITVEHDGEAYRDDFLVGLISNTVSICGLNNLVAKGVVLDDGLFEVTLIKMPNSPLELNSIINCLLRKDLTSDHFYTFKSSKVKFICEQEVAWTLDGENGGIHQIVEIINHKQALNIIVDNDDLFELSEQGLPNQQTNKDAPAKGKTKK
ncbi:MAG: diacylglycerol kinase family lipid kinase [Clostridiales bacterium]|nr:diacylglycerol kinase family lipid kinase [Clostridiales bacterium]